MRRTIFYFVAFALCTNVFAEGYQVNLQGNRQTGMGHAGTGLNLGASSIHFNPGALALMKTKSEFSLGGSLIFGKNTFQKQGSDYVAQTDNPIGTPFYFYGATKLNDKLAIGLGVTTPYGNSLKWDDKWDGRFLIQGISLKAIYVQPTISYAINEMISIGAGPVLAYGDVKLSKGLPLSDAVGEGSAELNGNTMAYGFNAGIYLQPTPELSFGMSYRSKINMKLDEGTASFDVPDVLIGSTSFPAETKFNAELPLPANLVFGAGYKVSDKLTLALDLQYVFWSTYDSLNFDFEFNSPSLADSKNARNYENTLVYRLGAEYKVTDKFMGRAGFAYDSTPITKGYLTPETPGANKFNYTLGLSYKFTEGLSVDVSFLFIKAQERKDGYADANFYGTYNTTAVIPGFGINYSF